MPNLWRKPLPIALARAPILAAALALAFATPAPAAPTTAGARRSLDAFNREFVAACQRMDHKADASFWADDGVDLLPGLAPMVGKAKITAWLDSLTPQLAGAKMRYCAVDWQKIEIHGDLAYEWGMNRQKIDFPAPQKPYESDGKILLILKHQAGGSWKVLVEAWNANPDRHAKP